MVTEAYQTTDFISKWAPFVAILAAGAMIVVGVTSRYVFNYPLLFVDEYSAYLYVVIVLLPLSYVLRTAGHIRLNIVVKALPRRVASYLDIVTIFVSLGVIIVLTVGATQLAMDSLVVGRVAWTPMATPLGPVQLIVPIGLGLIAIQIIVEIAHRIKAQGAPHARTINH